MQPEAVDYMYLLNNSIDSLIITCKLDDEYERYWWLWVWRDKITDQYEASNTSEQTRFNLYHKRKELDGVLSVAQVEKGLTAKITSNNRRNTIAEEWLTSKNPDLNNLNSKQILDELISFKPDAKNLFISGGKDWLNRDHSVIPKRGPGLKKATK